MRRWPTPPCSPWSAASITPSRFETVAHPSYTAPMRSPGCRPRIHIRSRRYCGHGSRRLPTGNARLALRRNTTVKLVEPPSCRSVSTIVFIGKNSRGNWVAQEQHGLYGGLFVNRAQAIKYALFENGHHPETIVELSREIELDMGDKLAFPAAGNRRVA